jgi:hypothetical protein
VELVDLLTQNVSQLSAVLPFALKLQIASILEHFSLLVYVQMGKFSASAVGWHELYTEASLELE